MNKKENLEKNIADAEAKIVQIQNNISALVTKKLTIDKQIEANRAKISKIQFFLEKTKNTIASMDESRQA